MRDCLQFERLPLEGQVLELRHLSASQRILTQVLLLCWWWARCFNSEESAVLVNLYLFTMTEGSRVDCRLLLHHAESLWILNMWCCKYFLFFVLDHDICLRWGRCIAREVVKIGYSCLWRLWLVADSPLVLAEHHMILLGFRAKKPLPLREELLRKFQTVWSSQLVCCMRVMVLVL